MVYFPSSPSCRNQFISNPHEYISQVPPGPSVPITISIVGPPKSGKTTSKIVMQLMLNIILCSVILLVQYPLAFFYSIDTIDNLCVISEILADDAIDLLVSMMRKWLCCLVKGPLKLLFEFSKFTCLRRPVYVDFLSHPCMPIC